MLRSSAETGYPLTFPLVNRIHSNMAHFLGSDYYLSFTFISVPFALHTRVEMLTKSDLLFLVGSRVKLGVVTKLEPADDISLYPTHQVLLSTLTIITSYDNMVKTART